MTGGVILIGDLVNSDYYRVSYLLRWSGMPIKRKIRKT